MSNFKVRRQGEIRVVISSHQRTDRDFLLDNDAFINKGNKQAAKRARVASKSRKAAKQYRAESMRVLTPPTAGF
jgi:ABC-type multidrug transport system ATPase subunit